MDPAFVAFRWRALWLSFIASAVPAVLYTVSGVVGLARAGLSPAWVSVLGWISAGACGGACEGLQPAAPGPHPPLVTLESDEFPVIVTRQAAPAGYPDWIAPHT